MTKFISEKCSTCDSNLIPLDKHYNLPECYNFILMCPDHPSEILFDISNDEMCELANSDLDCNENYNNINISN
jgi:hypothetical protein